MGIREEIDASPAELDREAREQAESGDSRFWDWLTKQAQWCDLVDRYAEERVSEHYIRAG